MVWIGMLLLTNASPSDLTSHARGLQSLKCNTTAGMLSRLFTHYEKKGGKSAKPSLFVSIDFEDEAVVVKSPQDRDIPLFQLA
jgi:hypothetical protein